MFPTRVRRITVATLVSVSLIAVPTLVVAPAAYADVTFNIEWTHIGIYPHSTPTMDPSARAGAAVPDGTPITIVCEAEGATVTSDVGTSDIWERTDAATPTWYPNAFVNTGYSGWTPGVPRCDSDASTVQTPAPPDTSAPAGEYDRLTAANWAAVHWNDDPRYTEDCTWFVSQALWQGGVAKDDNWTDSTWNPFTVASLRDYPGPTQSAVNAQDLVNYLVDSGKATETKLEWSQNAIPNVQLGDIIAYDWGHNVGNDLVVGPDGTIDHLMIVTSFSGSYANVTGHTTNTASTGWSWSPGGNNWWQYAYENKEWQSNGYAQYPIAYLIHITY